MSTVKVGKGHQESTLAGRNTIHEIVLLSIVNMVILTKTYIKQKYAKSYQKNIHTHTADMYVHT